MNKIVLNTNSNHIKETTSSSLVTQFFNVKILENKVIVKRASSFSCRFGNVPAQTCKNEYKHITCCSITFHIALHIPSHHIASHYDAVRAVHLLLATPSKNLNFNNSFEYLHLRYTVLLASCNIKNETTYTFAVSSIIFTMLQTTI